MRKALLSVFLPAFFFLSAFAQQPAEQVIAEALKPSSIGTNLEVLTDQIGGRVPGSPAMDQAVAWGVAAFKAAGADSVHTEPFTIQSSWAEGVTRMSVVAPHQFPVKLVSFTWAPALAPHRRVPIVDVGGGSEEEFAKAGKIAGAIVLAHSNEMKVWDDLFKEYLNSATAERFAVKGHALALAFQSTRPHDLLYRHTNAAEGEIDIIPNVLIAREDAGRIARLIASGQKVYADISVPNRVGGPIKAANVVAEIKGSERPNEIVVLGAHLDSWELGTGALDNGCNAALVIDALRAIKASGLHPKRTIRFILFSGEEEGMVGSRAYTNAHRAELDNTVGMVVVDSGIGHITGFSLGGRKDILARVVPMVAPLQQFGANELTTDASWGTDNFDFMLEGVPTFTANQEEGNYLINYHAMSDTFDKVDIEVLKNHVADAAYLTFALADSDQRVGRRLGRAEIEETMHETHLDDQLKTFGMWKDWESGKRGRAK